MWSHAARDDLSRLLPARAARHLRLTLSLLAAGLTLLLSACEKLPQPFEPEDKTVNPLVVPVEGGNLVVLPVEGAIPSLPDGGATLLAVGLTQGGLPATADGETAQSRYLQASVAITKYDDANDLLLIAWDLYSNSGRPIERFAQEARAPGRLWLAGDAETLVAVAQAAAPLLADALPRPQPVAAKPALSEGAAMPRIVVAGLKGAPGDGKTSVPRALTSVLVRQGFEVPKKAKKGDYIVEGTMTLDPPAQGQQRVRLVWRVLDGPGGESLGEIEQANAIPAGSLDGPWGDTAVIVAMGTAEGVLELLQKAGRL